MENFLSLSLSGVVVCNAVEISVYISFLAQVFPVIVVVVTCSPLQAQWVVVPTVAR